jgi:hypothetical protein
MRFWISAAAVHDQSVAISGEDGVSGAEAWTCNLLSVIQRNDILGSSMWAIVERSNGNGHG